MRSFNFIRSKDISGVSGTGIVLEGVQFTDGTVVVRWLSEHSSTAIYNSIHEFVEIHGHGNAGEIKWVQ